MSGLFEPRAPSGVSAVARSASAVSRAFIADPPIGSAQLRRPAAGREIPRGSQFDSRPLFAPITPLHEPFLHREVSPRERAEGVGFGLTKAHRYTLHSPHASMS